MANNDTPDTYIAPRKTPLPALSRNEFKAAEFVNSQWRCVVPAGTPRERLTDSDFWSLCSQLMTPFDIVHVIEANRAYYAQLFVVEAGRGFAHVEVLHFHPLAPLLVPQGGDIPPNHEIIHLGPNDLYGVRRISDSVLLGKGFQSRADALSFLLDHASLR